MSNLVYQNYNNKCQGWVNPSNILFGPQITTLSGYQSPAGSNTVVSINGTNFYSYSSISFGTFNPTVYFINSNLLQFYVPNTLSSGTFPVQVFNGSIGSNIVNYTIDNASGYWLLNPSGSISNTNTSGVGLSWLSRGKPTYIDGTSNPYPAGIPYLINDYENWILCYPNGFDIYIKLPSGNKYNGREIMFKTTTIAGLYKLVSDANNIQYGNPSVTNNIIVNSGGTTIALWTTLVYNGDTSKWIVMQSNW